MLKRLASLAPALVALFLLIACGPPSMEGQISAFQRNIDQMDALAAKNPQFKASIDAKKMEFKADRRGRSPRPRRPEQPRVAIHG
jgi:hypothetical protein